MADKKILKRIVKIITTDIYEDGTSNNTNYTEEIDINTDENIMRNVGIIIRPNDVKHGIISIEKSKHSLYSVLKDLGNIKVKYYDLELTCSIVSNTSSVKIKGLKELYKDRELGIINVRFIRGALYIDKLL